MVAALAAGVGEIRVFDSLDAARAAAKDAGPRGVLCGEEKCLRPADFDLGNSPGGFNASHRGATLFMATTNGTRAIVAAQGAAAVFVGALVNAAAVARAVSKDGRDVTLLCAGTDGQIAMEDLIGAGAVIAEIQRRMPVEISGDAARVAQRLFDSARNDLLAALRDAQGGRNVIAAGLDADIEFAARLNAIDAVGVVHPNPLRVAAASAFG